MSCKACDTEPTEARHLARGERQRNPESPTHPPFGERKKQITHSSRVCNRAAVVVFLGAFRSPHSRLWRQYGVIDDVTAHAVNITGFQYVCSVGAFPRRWCVWVSHRLIWLFRFYYFLCGFRDFCEKLLFLSQTRAQPRERLQIQQTQGQKNSGIRHGRRYS